MIWVKANHRHWNLPYHIERKVSAIEIVFPEKMRFPNKEPLFQIPWIILFKYRHKSRLATYPWYLGFGTGVFGLIFPNTLIDFEYGTWLFGILQDVYKRIMIPNLKFIENISPRWTIPFLSQLFKDVKTYNWSVYLHASAQLCQQCRECHRCSQGPWKWELISFC